MRVEASGNMRMMIVDHKGDLHPQIVVEDTSERKLLMCSTSRNAMIMVRR